MKKLKQNHLLVLLIALVFYSCTSSENGKTISLKEGFADKFYIGTALNEQQITGQDTAAVRVIKEQFNAIVAENCMKSEEIQATEGEFDFTLADQFVEFGEQNGMFITGHTLIWHSQAPRWFFTDSEGNDVSREVMIERMKNHIYTVAGRYKGRVKGWDVVNEAIEGDGSYRNSKFYQIVGEDFIKLAFQFAHEADPDAELYYNDYSMDSEGKRNGVVAMVKKLQEEGIRIDGIGMQTHVGLEYPKLDEFEKSVKAYAGLGLKVMITEMDVTVLPMPGSSVGAEISTNFDYQAKYNPYTEGLPDSVNVLFENRYLDFFKLFLKYEDNISRVTMWGVDDGQSWKNNWPVKGRTDYTLLIDRNYQPKPVVEKLIEVASQEKL